MAPFPGKMYKSDKTIFLSAGGPKCQEVNRQRVYLVPVLGRGEPGIFFKLPDQVRLVSITGIIRQGGKVCGRGRRFQAAEEYMQLYNSRKLLGRNADARRKCPLQFSFVVSR